MKRSRSQKESLKNTVSKYHSALTADSPAGEYLESRGLPLDKVARFRLGYVSEPEIGHEAYLGRLAIPYLRRNVVGEWSVVSIKFRYLEGCSSPGKKYLGLPGDEDRLFNTIDAIDNEDEICITEGELDAVAASSFGIPAVGVSGATKWRDHWSEIFYGYETVYALTDGDKAGREFGTMVSRKLGNVKIIPMDDDQDVNSMIHLYGVEKILERMGKL